MSTSTFCRISCKGVIILIIGRVPASVSLLNVGQVRTKLYSKSWTQLRRESKFKAVDQVCISKSRRTFRKGYLPSWTQGIFTMTKIIPRVPPIYRLRDYADDEIEDVFYAEEYTSLMTFTKFKRF